MKNLLQNKQVQGELIMVFENMLWALFPIMIILSISFVPPIFALGISLLFAAGFMGVVLTVRGEWHQAKVGGVMRDILASTFLISVLFYLLFFIGLKSTSAGNASIMALMEVFFTMLILGLWKKEKQTLTSAGGGALMVAGAVLVLFHGEFSINNGDFIILLATAMCPAGNYFMKRARKKVGTVYILFVRSLIAGMFLLGVSFFVEETPVALEVYGSIWFLLINGVVLLGFSKILWVEAIHRISVTKAISLITLGPPFTLIFAFFILGEVPTVWQIAGFVPIAVGVWVVTELRRV